MPTLPDLPLRDEFLPPSGALYFDGNSLGPASRAALGALDTVVAMWRERGIAGWTEGSMSWLRLEREIAAMLSPLVGADPSEVSACGSTTANLHQLLSTLWRPAPGARRRKLLTDALAFPTDRYALQSQLALRGLDPRTDLVLAAPRGRELDERALADAMTDEVHTAVVPAVLYTTGQLLDVPFLARAARERGVLLGVDCSHSIGAVPHALSAWGVDFAFWCSYKYLNAGPGAVGGLFLHRRHLGAAPGLAGWFGAAAEDLFSDSAELRPAPHAGRLQMGTPHVFSLAPLRGALEAFNRFGIERLRARSLELTTHFRTAIASRLARFGVTVATPREDARRGGHLALAHPEARRLCLALRAAGVVPDFRAPDLIRLTPAPLYADEADCDEVVNRLEHILAKDAHLAFPASDGPVP